MVDSNNDELVAFEELKNWIEHQRKAYIWDATLDRVIRRDDENKDRHISWSEYKHAHYGKWDNESAMDKNLRTQIDKAYIKFNVSDKNKDGRLHRDEYAYFRHPEESPDLALQEIAVDEVLEEMDKDNNRLIDLNEYVQQYKDDGAIPEDWITRNRNHFTDSLDLNKNGYLERNEIRNWVLPNINDTVTEAKHLIKYADDNGDGKLNITEILHHYELFVGSTATNHGKVLREEL